MQNVARLQDLIPAVAEMHRFILCTRRSGGTAHEGGGGATSHLDLPSLTPLRVGGPTSQLDLPSLTPLYAAG